MRAGQRSLRLTADEHSRRWNWSWSWSWNSRSVLALLTVGMHVHVPWLQLTQEEPADRERF